MVPHGGIIMKKYYVVLDGNTKGVVDSYDKCLILVYGVTHRFHGCASWEEVVDRVLMEMSDTGPYIYDVKGKSITFKTFARFRDYVMAQSFR